MRVLLSCGEASGDLYAAALVGALRDLRPDVEVAGFGGPRLAAAGAALVGRYDAITVTGLAEVLAKLPASYRLLRRVVQSARERRPDVFVAIDFPDFNFRLLPEMRRLGVPVVYYISPQVWAWRRGRLRTIQRYVDRMLVIFPFEQRLYEDAGVPVEFVGHPLVELIPPAPRRDDVLARAGLDPARPVVALLPGSRPNEVRHMLPGVVGAVQRLHARRADVQYVLAAAPGLSRDAFAAFDALGAGAGTTTGVRTAVVDGDADSVLAVADAAITASGTATVQAALHGCPMVIVYRVSPLTYAIGRRLVRVSTYGMVNLIAGRPIVPELIQEAFTPERVADAVWRLLSDPSAAATMRADLADVRARLGGPGASARAARGILDAAHSALH